MALSARLAIDTPYRSLITKAKPLLRGLKGDILEVGAGNQFFRPYMIGAGSYRALELKNESGIYGWEKHTRNMDLYDGKTFPYENGSYDSVVCFEVLEHCEDPDLLLSEIFRVLRPGGSVVLSVPFAAKWHYVPYDYWRFTPSGLGKIMARANLPVDQTIRRGTDFAVGFHSLASATIGLVFAPNFLTKILGALLLPLGCALAGVANLLEYLDIGNRENALGYIVKATKGSP